MIVSDIPASITAAIGDIVRLTESPQGMTSTVAIAETAQGRFAIKRAEGTLYGSWLTSEYRVLTALATADSGVRRLAPRPRAFTRVDGTIVPERWLAMDYLAGRTLEAVLHDGVNAGTRSRLLHNFGQTLAQIHATPPPAALPRPTPSWLEFMLEEAGENLEHFNVDGTPQLLSKLRTIRPQIVAPTLIHGDYSIDNVIVEGDEVIGVIDWSGGAVGDRRYDIALATRPQHVAFEADRAQDLAAFYDGYGSVRLSQADYDYFIGLYEFF